MNVPGAVTRLREVLGQVPDVTGIDHARTFVAQDETEQLPDVLTFHYRGAQFFARVVGETFSLEPAARSFPPPVGQGNVYKVKPSEIAVLLDPHILPGITLSEYGDHVVFPAQTTEATKITRFPGFTHGLCGGCFDRHDISPSYFALSCRSCHLRVCVPTKVVTLGDLRAWSKEMAENLWGHGLRVGKRSP